VLKRQNRSQHLLWEKAIIVPNAPQPSHENSELFHGFIDEELRTLSRLSD
jgi:hypothetical protein